MKRYWLETGTKLHKTYESARNYGNDYSTPDGRHEVVFYADAQATVDLAKAEGAAEVRKVIQQRLIDVKLARSVARLSFAQDEYDAQISALESILKQCEEPFSSNNENGPDWQATVEALQAQLKTARYDAVRAFVRGEDKMCFVCGAKEPCELKDDPSSPCTFDPTPMELKQQVDALQRVRDEFERERDQLHAALMEAKAALDAEREKVKGLHEVTRVICTHCCEPMEIPSKAVLQTQLTQLQALVRAVSDTMEPFRKSLAKLDEVDTLATRRIAEADAYYCAQRVLATLDATTPDSNQLGDINDMVSKGGDGE